MTLVEEEEEESKSTPKMMTSKKGNKRKSGGVIRSKLNLVDLAGSEKWNVHQDIAQAHISELTNINLSLHTLGRCIEALAKPSHTYVPYRESKLTRLLQDSLGGSAKTRLFAMMSPSELSAEEAQATLRTRRPRPLSESILDAAVGAVLNASATKEEGGGGDGLGKVASWVAQERERMLVESEAKERYGRLALFEADLELLGVTVDEAVTMDAKQLTPAPYPPTPTLPLTSTPIPNPNPKPQPEPGGYGREVAAPSLPRPLPRTAPRRARPTLGRGARGSAKRVRAQRRLRSREEAAGEDLKKRHRWRT